MNPSFVIGVDPGTEGAACRIWVSANGDTSYKICRFGTLHKSEVWAWFHWNSLPSMKVYMEDVHARRGDFGPQLAKFMTELGIILGFCTATKMEIAYVDPKVWQREFGLGGKYESNTARKNAHKQKAIELTGEKVTLDQCDAILIAIYGWRKENGKLTHGKDENKTPREARGILWGTGPQN